MTAGALVVPLDLLQGIVDSGLIHGWFAGLGSTSENLMVVCATTVGENLLKTNFGDRIWSHRMGHPLHGHYDNHLLEWWVVAQGFNKRFCSQTTLSDEDFRSFLPADIGDEGRFLAALEVGETDPHVLTVLWTARDGETVKTEPLEIIKLAATAQPYVKLPHDLVDVLSSRCVVVVGLGSGGAELALNLACSGIGHLKLIDPDRLHPENYFRFIAGSSQLGRKKVDVVWSAILDRELRTKVTTHFLNVVTDADQFRDIVSEGTDLLICATDSVVSRRTVNATAVALGKPCLIAGTLDGGRIGEALNVMPYQTACYECVRSELGAALQLPADDERSSAPYVGTDVDSTDSAALRSDVTLIAALATRMALSVLAPVQFSSLPAQYLVWGRDAGSLYPEPFRFEVPLSTNYVPIKRRKECPLCGALPPELVGIDVTTAKNEIIAELEAERR